MNNPKLHYYFWRIFFWPFQASYFFGYSYSKFIQLPDFVLIKYRKKGYFEDLSNKFTVRLVAGFIFNLATLFAVYNLVFKKINFEIYELWFGAGFFIFLSLIKLYVSFILKTVRSLLGFDKDSEMISLKDGVLFILMSPIITFIWGASAFFYLLLFVPFYYFFYFIFAIIYLLTIRPEYPTQQAAHILAIFSLAITGSIISATQHAAFHWERKVRRHGHI